MQISFYEIESIDANLHLNEPHSWVDLYICEKSKFTEEETVTELALFFNDPQTAKRVYTALRQAAAAIEQAAEAV